MPIGALTVLVAYLAQRTSGLPPADHWALPGLAAVFALLSVLLWWRRSMLDPAITLAYMCLGAYCLISLDYQFRAYLPRYGSLSEVTYYFAVVYVLAFAAWDARRALWWAGGVAVVALLLGALRVGPLLAASFDLGIASFVGQFYGSSLFVIGMLYIVAYLKQVSAEQRLRQLEAVHQLALARYQVQAEREAKERAEAEVRELYENLEARVQQRTQQLENLNAELEAFSYSVSHYLRSPLTHIVGFSDVLRRLEGQLDAQTRRHLEIIERASWRMSEMLDALLEFSQLNRKERTPEVVDLAALIARVRADLEVEEQMQEREVVWEICELGTVVADLAMLRFVLHNLLSNALKYTRPRPVARIRVAIEETPLEWVVTVSDNGVGFDAAGRDDPFGLFQRLHPDEEFEGSGIGLANVKRLIGRHGGRVWAESEVGVGSRFCFSLPRDTSALPASQAENPDPVGASAMKER